MSAKSGVKMKEMAEPLTVLLVEDTEDNRFMMRRLLEMSGYRVIEAMNGEEAVKLAETGSPQLILMDLSLPVIDGLAATRLIRKLPEFCQYRSLRFRRTTRLTFNQKQLKRAATPTLRNPSISTS